MKLKSFPPSYLHSRSHRYWILALFILTLILLIPSGGTMADSNAPTETNTPEATDTAIPVLPTETQIPPAAATNTPIPIFPTEVDENSGAIAIATLPAPGNGGGLSTLNRLLLVVLGIAVVVVIGVIVYIFINQTRGEMGGP